MQARCRGDQTACRRFSELVHAVVAAKYSDDHRPCQGDNGVPAALVRRHRATQSVKPFPYTHAHVMQELCNDQSQ